MLHKKAPPLPPSIHPPALTVLKQLLIRFSLGLFLLVSVIIIGLGEIDSKLTELVRMRVIDRLLPLMHAMSWPVDYVVQIGDKVNELFLLQTENKWLREENRQLREHYNLSRHIQGENDELRKLLKVVDEPKASFITARVVGDVSGPYVRSALINAGEENGVQKNQLVLNEQGVVGRIIEVGKRSARILLLTDINSKIPAITSLSRERIIAAGDNSETIKILYLPEDNKVKIGEQLLTSGDGEMFPAGLLLGTVYAATNKAFYIKPAVQWNHLGYVRVINNKRGE